MPPEPGGTDKRLSLLLGLSRVESRPTLRESTSRTSTTCRTFQSVSVGAQSGERELADARFNEGETSRVNRRCRRRGSCECSCGWRTSQYRRSLWLNRHTTASRRKTYHTHPVAGVSTTTTSERSSRPMVASGFSMSRTTRRSVTDPERSPIGPDTCLSGRRRYHDRRGLAMSGNEPTRRASEPATESGREGGVTR